MEAMSRAGTFSSSSMWKLLTLARDKRSFGEKAISYIKQVGYERELGRPINKETKAKATSWGTLVEKRVFDLLPTQYQLVSQDRLVHPEYPFWTGAPDLIKGNAVADCKCPFSLEVFCDKVRILSDVEAYKSDFPEDYWQHISNSILLEKNGVSVSHFEAIIYCPYEDELADIRLMVNDVPPEQQWAFKWLEYAFDDELPYLKRGGKYQNINIANFPVPQEDKDKLEAAVVAAEKILSPSVALVSYDSAVNATIVTPASI